MELSLLAYAWAAIVFDCALAFLRHPATQGFVVFLALVVAAAALIYYHLEGDWTAEHPDEYEPVDAENKKVVDNLMSMSRRAPVERGGDQP